MKTLFLTLGLLLSMLVSGCADGTSQDISSVNPDDQTSVMQTDDVGGMSCTTQMDQDSSMHQVCCKQAGEVPTKALGCGSAVAYGCELDTQCTFYTTDGAVTHPCPAGKSCNDCFVDWESGIDDWCGRQ